jgi:short subunit fatty acids transporter
MALKCKYQKQSKILVFFHAFAFCFKILVLSFIFIFNFTDPSELRVVKKECFNRWYSLLPYYFALTLSRLPLQIVLNVLFSSLVYFLAGLPHEPWRFVMFAFIGVVTSFVAEGLGLAIGATFSVTNGCAIGPMLMAPFLGLATYGFDFAADIPGELFE